MTSGWPLIVHLQGIFATESDLAIVRQWGCWNILPRGPRAAVQRRHRAPHATDLAIFGWQLRSGSVLQFDFSHIAGWHRAKDCCNAKFFARLLSIRVNLFTISTC